MTRENNNNSSNLSSPTGGQGAVHYHDYLELDKILNAQHPESSTQNISAHDEMLFIIIHQTYELWFKQLHHEADSLVDIMKKPSLNDNSPELQTVVHRLNRMAVILRVLVHQIDILETMTPMDFLDFRDMLCPASGFQSWQFKLLEAKLGLKFEYRHGKEYYTAQLKTEHVDLIKQAENNQSFLQLVNDWLERMPFSPHPNLPPSGEGTANTQNPLAQDENRNKGTSTSEVSAMLSPAGGIEGGCEVGAVASFPEEEGRDGAFDFWNEYKKAYSNSLAEAEKNNLEAFDEVLFQHTETHYTLSAKANRAALFIMLYRGYPLLQLPFQLLNNLLAIDEQLSTWRHRHMNMVHRMIGTRIGTGGSSGKDYLKAAADKHYIFKEIAQLTSFLIERRKLPQLPKEMERKLGFASG